MASLRFIPLLLTLAVALDDGVESEGGIEAVGKEWGRGKRRVYGAVQRGWR